MLMSASETLAKYSPLVINGEGLVLPELKDIHTVSRAIAFAVAKVATRRCCRENVRRGAVAGD
jgi:malate dehydrogenase (oxaloacetate-decarboxylating)